MPMKNNLIANIKLLGQRLQVVVFLALPNNFKQALRIALQERRRSSYEKVDFLGLDQATDIKNRARIPRKNAAYFAATI